MIHLLLKISILFFLISSAFGCVAEFFGMDSDFESKYVLVEKIGFCNTKEPPKGEDWKKCRT